MQNSSTQERNKQIKETITELNKIVTTMNQFAESYPAVLEANKKLNNMIKERNEISYRLSLLEPIKTYTEGTIEKLASQIASTPKTDIRTKMRLRKSRHLNEKNLEQIKEQEYNLNCKLQSIQMDINAFLIANPHADSVSIFQRNFRLLVTIKYNNEIEKLNKLMNVDFPKKDGLVISSTPLFAMIEEQDISQSE